MAIANRIAAALLGQALALCAAGAGAVSIPDTGLVRLPAGVVEVAREITIPPGAHDLTIVGDPAGTTLRAAPTFQGRGLFACARVSNLTFRDFTIDGNRAALARPMELIPPENAFRLYYADNGIWADQARGLTIRRVHLVNIANFAILVSRSSQIHIEQVSVENSGSRNAKARNNTTGGILIEEGAADFRVTECEFRGILGNALWTHSLYTSPRNRDGLFAGNHFDTIGRDAIQVGHATNVRVERNTGVRIGYPHQAVDIEHDGTPVAVDTAGNVDHTVYAGNRFEEINGKCFDLDGFHDGEVSRNTCINRGAPEDYPTGHFALVMNNSNPDMTSRNITIADNEIDGAKFGGFFIIGTGHRVLRNHLRHLNTAHCTENAAKFGCYYGKDQPDLMRSGIYLTQGVKRMQQTRGNLIENNSISGYKMKTRCIAAAPGVSLADNTILDNDCRDGESSK